MLDQLSLTAMAVNYTRAQTQQCLPLLLPSTSPPSFPPSFYLSIHPSICLTRAAFPKAIVAKDALENARRLLLTSMFWKRT